MKTGLSKRILALCLIGLYMILSVFSEMFTVFAEEISSVQTTVAEPQTEAGDSSYNNYYSVYGDVGFAEDEIVVELNTVIEESTAVFSVMVPKDALYNVGMCYKALGEENDEIKFSLKVDGVIPFDEAEKFAFPRLWIDEETKRVDGLGNEFNAKQVLYREYCTDVAKDITKWTAEPYYVYLTAGIHEIEISPKSGGFEIKEFIFGVDTEAPKYDKPSDKESFYDGESVIVEAENALYKNSYWLVSRTDNSSVNVSPNSVHKSLLNYIGGGTWKTTGETITWETPELSAGYYQLGFSYRQSAVIGGKAYRELKIDGSVPFREAESIGFSYDDNWQQSFFADSKGKPYLIYLSEGKHTFSLGVVPGDGEDVCNLIKQAVAQLGSLYVDITMITGETVDTYRDYDLFSQIPDMEKQLSDISEKLDEASLQLKKINGQDGGSHVSIVNNMNRVITAMLDNRYTAHRYKSEYYDTYTALAAVLQEILNVPLDIDKFSFTAVGAKKPFERTGVLKQLTHSTQRFLLSFIQDYNNISASSNEDESLTIWINWGRDQAQVLNSLVQSDFTEETDIAVNIKLVAASVIQAMISGKGPDCILQQSRSEPVNLAMRGALYNLSKFDDVDSVLARFQDGAETPYYYKGNLYALPDTQGFYLLFYRKDILDEMGIDVPETWDDFRVVTKLLARNNLSVYMPNNVATNAAQVNAGIGSLNLFPTFLMQKGLDIYKEDGSGTNLSDAEVMVTFGEWTDYYRKLGIPKTMDFYNRFRTGTCPMGVSTYSMYTTLKAAAAEIDGLWDVALVPGTERPDGTVSHTTSGSGSACAILKSTKNPEAAWEFLKWWTDADTQLSFSNEVESILGPTGRIAVSNVEAFEKMSWDEEMVDTMLTSWEQVEEIAEYPGSYYVSRSVYQGFWDVINNNSNPKDVLLKYGKQADEEMERKWKQYSNR